MAQKANSSSFQKTIRDATDVAMARGNRLFVGSLDDSVSRFPWDGFEPNVRFLNDLLIEHALFGAPLCCRGGSLLYHEPYLRALLGEEESPLLDMIESGFFQIQMRVPSINEAVAGRLAENTLSSQAFKAKYNWKPGSEIFNRIEKLDGRISEGKGKVIYSPDFRAFTQLLMVDAELASNDAFKRVFETWVQSPKELQTRNTFEIIARRLFAADEDSMRRAMWIANSVNHFAYGSAMQDHDPTNSIAVETSDLGPLVTACAAQQRVAEDAGYEAYEKARKDKILTKLEAHLTVPRSLVVDINAQRRLASALDPDRATEKPVARFLACKSEILSGVGSILTDADSLPESELMERARRYSSALEEVLGLTRSEKVRVRVSALPRQVWPDAKKHLRSAAGAGALAQLGLTGLGPFGLAFGVVYKLIDGDRLVSKFKRFFSSKDVRLGEGRNESAAAAGANGALVQYGTSVSTRIINPSKVSNLRRRLGGDQSTLL